MTRIAQAGAIAFKSLDREPYVLLVRARKNPQAWIFPKGHIEIGEPADAAAARELEEEAGIKGRLLGPVGTLDFQSGDEEVRVEYYLFEFVAYVNQLEERRVVWCEYDEALKLLSYPDAAQLLRKAFPMIKGHIRGLPTS